MLSKIFLYKIKQSDSITCFLLLFMTRRTITQPHDCASGSSGRRLSCVRLHSINYNTHLNYPSVVTVTVIRLQSCTIRSKECLKNNVKVNGTKLLSRTDCRNISKKLYNFFLMFASNLRLLADIIFFT